MTLKFAGIWVSFLLVSLIAPFGNPAWAQPAAAPVAQEQDLSATRELVREIQFMLLRLGFDPGPLDGMPRQLTNAAVQRFEQANGLPRVELQPGGKVPAEFLARLRAEAARVMFGAAGKPETEPRSSPSPVIEQPPATLPTAAVAPAPPKPPPPDRFSSCAYNPEDFQIGAKRYTPDTFLNEGFDGSTTRAVASLKDRLEEGRQLADKIGISALKEVQRQARVVQYFECRLKIEQAAASKPR
jgi:peptidoglycan hydrolase-like protein with peptidoglycan-binding domain